MGMINHHLPHQRRYVLPFHLHVVLGTCRIVHKCLQARDLQHSVAGVKLHCVSEAREKPFSSQHMPHFLLHREVGEDATKDDDKVHVATVCVEHLEHRRDRVLVHEFLYVRLADRKVQERQRRARHELRVLEVMPYDVHDVLQSVMLAEHHLDVILCSQVRHAGHDLAHDVWAVPPELRDITQQTHSSFPRNFIPPVRVIHD
mmetsp:Transcript_70073/g.193853  ORF Transcript_70073/g.193853 Transcript_70073/m.193853 type:complete len:202 (-) Transcript_70073:525-1130(-)